MGSCEIGSDNEENVLVEINMSNQTPFDCRPNHKAVFDNILSFFWKTIYTKTDSKFVRQIREHRVEAILEDLPEIRYIQNVALMMFCEYPKKFFWYTYVQMISFPEGSVKNPSVSEDFPNIIVQFCR